MQKHSDSHVDELLIRVVDSDQQWGPLLFLRPALNEHFGALRMLVLSLLIGGAFGLPGSILLALTARAAHRPALPLFAFPLVLTVVYFCVCQLSIVPAWNRRAQRLSNRRVGPFSKRP